MSKITISVNGANASGKTHIIAAIHNMLADNNLTNKVTITGVDNSAQGYQDIRDRIKTEPLNALLPDLEIEIVEHYGNGRASDSQTSRAAVETEQTGGDDATDEEVVDTEVAIERAAPEPYKVPLIPIIRPESAERFVSQELFPPTEAVVLDGHAAVQTSFLKFGSRLDLLGISMDTVLIAEGVLDGTDMIEPAISLKQIAFEYKGAGIVALVENMAMSTFYLTDEGNFRDLEVNFSATLPYEGDNQVVVHVTGTISLELGTTELNAVVTGGSKPVEEAPVPVGYALNINRANYNRRPVVASEKLEEA